MAINKKLIHFNTLEKFKENLKLNEDGTIASDSNILGTSIVFIKDAKLIWTHGQYYGYDSVQGDLKDRLDAIDATIEENELITARALVELEKNKANAEDVEAIYLKKTDATGANVSLSSSYAPAIFPEDTGDGEFTSLTSGETLDSAIKKLDQNIANLVQEVLDNEEVYSAALTDINENKTTLAEVDSIYLRKENLPTSLKNPYKLTIKKNNSTLADYDGSSSKSVNLSFNSEEITIGSNYNTVEYSGNISFDSISSGETLSTSLNSLENNISNLAGKVADNEEVTAASLVDLNERVNSKQDILVSGENIKTIGGQSIVGSGNIDIDVSNLVDLTSNQTISGEKKFTNTINIADKTDIAVNIDSGELKVFHHDPNNAEGKQNKGFILRSKINENEEIPSVELLGTNGDASYQYNFPKTNGNVALGAKINGKVHSASLEDGLISFEIGDYISATDITHGELLELKNNKQLKPGQPYRIIDYITTTNGRENSSSANHKFDLIVEALTTDQLSESAKACHAKYLNEEYSYDITNPLCGHTIAVANWGGVGINDIPNGIKNLPFTAEDGDDVRSVTVASYKQSAITCNEGSIKVIWQWQNGEGHTKKINILGVELIDASDNRIISSDYHIGSTGTTNNSNIYTVAAPKTGTYKFKYYIDGKTEEVNSSCTVYAYPVQDYFENSNLSAWEIGYNIENNVDRYRWAQTDGTGKGVIYYMKDEFCNEATYDFKNIKYNDKYTFSYTIDNVLYDGSVKYGSYCHHNVVGPDMIVGGTQFKGLSKIYFLNTAANAECNNNIIYNNCWDIQFGSGCCGNKIGVSCEQIYLGDNCSLNTFGDETQKITLGSNSIQNHFGEKCYNCKISSDSSGNSALTHVKNVSFGNECNGVILWTSNTNTSDFLQNYKLGNSLTGSIEISGENTRGRSYTTEINFNTSGEIKQFYLSEITKVKEDLSTLSDVVSGKQNTLVSGENIKTINGESIIGSGNIDINLSEYIKKSELEDTDDLNLPNDYIPSVYPEKTGSGEFSELSAGESLSNAVKKLDQNLVTLVEETIKNEMVNASGLTLLNENKADKTSLSKVATTGSYNDLLDAPEEVTKTTVEGWGFTKNTGTITGIKMNGVSKGTSGVVNLGTVITKHQDISHLALKSEIPAEVTKATVENWGFTKNIGTITGIMMNGVSKGTSGIVNLGTVITDISGKQDTLVSGSNIKTINGESLLGAGDIIIEAGNLNANVQAVDTSETLDDVETNTYVKYVAQTLTEEQKAQVRKNIGAGSTGNTDLTNYVKKEDLSDYYTKSEIDALLGDVNTMLESIINT